ncbi:hypothetical protein [Nocardioides soli]|uniref:Uncharacterized protein n=1 Tax=Nocardioides soli TaxID=1036020 RepID=A0A7W4VYZ9_9ACTN|nr:hypothetical protein [Nocardioides soli]MBB3044393.1 hypothetical protein [Nocardioides soli]
MTTLEAQPTRKARADRRDGDLVWDGDRWRRWDGKKLRAAAYSLQPNLLRSPDSPSTWRSLDREQLEHGLALAVEQEILHNGATLVHHGPTGPVLAYRRPVNHLLHAIATVVTFGIWAFVWLLAVLDRREDRILLRIDEGGHVWATRGGTA